MDYKQEALKELGIYELRELARMLGVHSPTTKKREELEQEIVVCSKKNNGQQQNVQTPNKKGRPPKSIKKVENVLNIFMPKELAEVVLNRRVDNELSEYLRFCQSSNEEDEVINIVGYVRKTVSGEFYIRSNTDFQIVAAISTKIVASFNLIEGDKIKGTATKGRDDKFYSLSQINLLNDKEPIYDRVLADGENYVLANIEIEKLNGIEEGSKTIFVSENFRYSIEKMQVLCKNVEEDFKIIIFAPNISTYHKLAIEQNFKGDFIYTMSEDHPAYVYDAITNTINHANALARENEKVLIVVFDLFSVKQTIEEHYALETNNLSFQEEIEASRMTMKLLNTSKVLKSGGSITVVTTCMTHNLEEPFFKNSLKKNADKILYI